MEKQFISLESTTISWYFFILFQFDHHLEQPKNNLHILMKEDNDLKSKLNLNSRKLKRNKIARKKAHETYSKTPPSWCYWEREGAQPEWVPNVSLYDVGKESATNILWESAALGTTKSETSWFLLATFTKHQILCSLHYRQKLWYSLAPLLPCFPLHVLSIYLTSLPHLSSSLATPQTLSKHLYPSLFEFPFSQTLGAHLSPPSLWR